MSHVAMSLNNTSTCMFLTTLQLWHMVAQHYDTESAGMHKLVAVINCLGLAN